MSKHKTKINGRTEFVFRCERCGYETDSIDHKDYDFRPPVCPICRKPIGQEGGKDLPDNTRAKI